MGSEFAAARQIEDASVGRTYGVGWYRQRSGRLPGKTSFSIPSRHTIESLRNRSWDGARARSRVALDAFWKTYDEGDELDFVECR